MSVPHLVFRDRQGKLHPTPAASCAADLAPALGGSEAIARQVLDNRQAVLEAIAIADSLEATHADALAEQEAAMRAIRAKAKPPISQGEEAPAAEE